MFKPCASIRVLGGAIVVLATACASKSSTPEDAPSSGSSVVDEGSDATGAESQTEAMSTSLIGGDATSIRMASAPELVSTPGQLVLDAAGDVAKTLFQPAGCLVVTADSAGKSAKYVFDDCAGPHGLVHVSGEVDASWSSTAANQLTVNFSASGLKIGGATVTWTATANTTANGAARDMIWDGHFDGTTRAGRAIDRTNHKEYKWTVGASCLSVNGSSDGTVTGHELKTDVVSFSICAHACPEAGSEIKVTDVTTSNVYDVKWNAGNATYTGPGGKSASFTPACAQ